MELPKGLALMNVKDLLTMIEVSHLTTSANEHEADIRSGMNKTSESCLDTPLSELTYSIRFLRLSSEMFPFASHAKYGYDLSFADEGLKAAGDLANKYGHRITMHPGQASHPKHLQLQD
jgi:UV DNA damage endonuclease